LKAQIQLIDQEYSGKRSVIEAELKLILDNEDRKRKGLIGETYAKLHEINEARERAEQCCCQAKAYIE
jgi:hypothetical protein